MQFTIHIEGHDPITADELKTVDGEGIFTQALEAIIQTVIAKRPPPPVVDEPVVDPVDPPGHTDLMVEPEAIDKFVEENPPTEPEAEQPVIEPEAAPTETVVDVANAEA